MAHLCRYDARLLFDRLFCMNYWLLKSEPGNFSLDDLRARPEQREPWDGVRNFQARNFMRQMRAGDQAFFYHSNAKPSGIVGVVEIVGEARPDPTQFDPESRYFDAKASVDAPRWDLVIVQFVRAFPVDFAVGAVEGCAGACRYGSGAQGQPFVDFAGLARRVAGGAGAGRGGG